MNDDVKTFYDRFRDERMIGYRVDGSPRIDAAYKLAVQHLQPTWNVVDVGCGIGIFAENVARKFPSSKIIGIDLSEKNIEYAEETVQLPNVIFRAASVTTQFDVVRELTAGTVDAFCLIDVIEHIPEHERMVTLSKMAEIASPSGILILAYPSPEYQRYLIAENPTELQVIDNVIATETLLKEAQAAGWQLKEFRYVDLWMQNQYVHAVFQRNCNVQPLEQSSQSPIERFRFRFDRLFLRPRRVKKYSIG